MSPWIFALSFCALAPYASATETNLLSNGRFDVASQLDGWDVPDVSPMPPGSAAWNSDDADSDAASGSLEIQSAGYFMDTACVEVVPGAPYEFGGQSRLVAGTGASSFEHCWAYSDDACSSNWTALGRADYPLNAGWASATPITGTIPAGAHSVDCELYLSGSSSPPGASVAHFDNFYFLSMTAKIFADGFEAEAALP